MLDLNITLVFQLINFFIALFFLNWLLIKPIREIIKKRNGIMDDMASEADNFVNEARERLANYEAELAKARQEAGHSGQCPTIGEAASGRKPQEHPGAGRNRPLAAARRH